MSSYDDTLPPTIQVSDHADMTFLRASAYLARAHIRPGAEDSEEFYVPPHWHATHDELFHVVRGRLEVRIGAEKRFYAPEDGEKGEECVFEERTEPMDDEKELFFRNFLHGGMASKGFLEAVQIMYHGDMRPVLPVHVKWVEATLVNVVGGYLAAWLGYKLRFQSLKKTL
ncbi:hypothetical protein BJ912DRAFT_969035 [Pholiota molesta]|nr:hypothetical protein BJ912DRAFT_969035 [Pholiota molesta]